MTVTSSAFSVNPPPSRISVLDGWRGVAISLVLLSHFVPIFGKGDIFHSGRAGVELFFALSGVLIGRILFVERIALKDFAVRRFSRIVPSMWLFIAVVAPFATVDVITVLKDCIGLANVANNPIQLVHLWSVALELQGYLLLGALCYLCRRYEWRVVWLAAGFLAIVWLLVFISAWRHTDAYSSTYWHFPYRLTAMVTAAALISEDRLRGLCVRCCMPALAAGLALQFHAVPDCVKYTLGSCCLGIGCVGMTGATLPAALAWILKHRVMIALGHASYSLYLWQQVFFAWGSGAPWYARLALAIAFGFIADRVWDRRLHRWTSTMLSRFVVGPTRRQVVL